MKSTAKKPIRTNVSSALVGKATVKKELMGFLEGLLLLCVSECTYGAVEDHEAVVEVVMLHGGVAVELGQWVVAPGHTHTHTRSKKHTSGYSVLPHMHIQSYIHFYDSCSPAVPLYVGVVDSSVVQVMAERCNHQSQDLQIAQVSLSGEG